MRSAARTPRYLVLNEDSELLIPGKRLASNRSAAQPHPDDRRTRELPGVIGVLTRSVADDRRAADRDAVFEDSPQCTQRTSRFEFAGGQVVLLNSDTAI